MKINRMYCKILCALFLANNSMAETNDYVQSLNLNWCDKSQSPQKNFYQYANGTWQQKNPIPAAYSQWNVFSIVENQNIARIHNILLEAAKSQNATPGSAMQIVGDFFVSSMDEKRINELGFQPLKHELQQIQAMKDSTDLQAEIAHLHKIGVNALFGFSNMQDFHDSTQMIGAIVQGGLSLPNRDYYLKNTPEFQKIRDALLTYISTSMELLGNDEVTAARMANTILQIETKLAQNSMSNTEQRDPYAIYNMVKVSSLNKQFTSFIWSKYFTDMGQKNLHQVNMAMPKFFQSLDQILTTTSLDDWKIYLKWHLISEFNVYLSKPFEDAHFKMVSALTGIKTMHPRWRRFINNSNLAVSFAIGELYVKQYFSPQQKNNVLSIMHQIRLALKKDLSTLSWMQPSTRAAALKKLRFMEERVGYPDKWWDLTQLHITRDSYLQNVMNANQFLINRELNKIGKPIDRTEWAMPPQTVNAYYDPSMNNINMPAGILQPPFFDIKAPAAVNYGAIGWIIGHEMTHGFDDEGAKFDELGNLHNWWHPSDQKKFKALTSCIVNQFSKYSIGNNIFVQGNLVAGEAIADLGGLKLAYNAFHNSPEYKSSKVIDNVTPDQQFFLSAAHLWANNIRHEQELNLITVDPHPPAMYRVNGTLCNIPEFKQAFKELSAQVQSEKENKICKIW